MYVGEGVIMLPGRSSGGLGIRQALPFQVGLLSLFLEKSISCNLSDSKDELCFLDHSYAPLGLVIML